MKFTYRIFTKAKCELQMLKVDSLVAKEFSSISNVPGK